ncbi:MAG: amino acid transport protein [Zetaproteobacteria bacterium CG2_30_46_52]|nr:MAG: amino acid transport protein [Zetaproteobacteria bacterium CG2_30_46_52]
MDATTLYLGLFFGTLGFAYFWYGRKQREPLPLVCGLVLMVLPYFIINILLLILVGLAIIALPIMARN